ncbi:hypothetical protein ACJ6WF_35545 [Streptomyces sp. MMS24-I2-30]|uniref:hypothetical protein n=1 Tax=Streptomyces sp. MMS24-I2-30 TaxID=3351564 RepID=UPI003896A5A0
MRATHRVPLLIASAMFALSACGIPETGVVQAGGPASGIAPRTPVYFVRGGALVAVPFPTDRPGDAEAALGLLFGGPAPVDASGSLTSEVPSAPTTAVRLATAAPRATPPDGPTVSVRGDALAIRLPAGLGTVSRLGTEQLICTAAAAHRIGNPAGGTVTVTVSGDGGRHAEGTDRSCPDV